MADLFLLYPIEKRRGSLWRIAHVPGHIRSMGYGRLIRIRTHRRDADATIYVVAEAEVDKAIAILQRAVSQPNSEYEDLGRVSDTLLAALSLQSGQFART
jgi:hypothetical protein